MDHFLTENFRTVNKKETDLIFELCYSHTIDGSKKLCTNFQRGYKPNGDKANV